jgi:chromosome segregation ATPase
MLCVALSITALPGSAQTARSGGAPSAQLMQQMQQLASERTSLQAENTKLKKDLEDIRKDRDALKSAQQVLDKRAKSSESSLRESISQRDSNERDLAQAKARMQELIAKFKETLRTLQDIEAQSTAAKQSLTAREQELKVCVDHNLALYKLNQEVLTHLEHQSVWTRVAQTEPFTKIKRTQLENLVDEYKGRADDQLITPMTSSSSQPPQAPAAAAPPR